MGESGLRKWAKWPSLTAQNCGIGKFVVQTGNRVDEQMILARARRGLGVDCDQLAADDFEEGSEESSLRETRNDIPMLGRYSFAIFPLPVELPVLPSGDERPPILSLCISGNERRQTGATIVHPLVEQALAGSSNKTKKGKYIIPPFPPHKFLKGTTPTSYWCVKTECKLNLPSGETTIRCHLNYHEEGPWYDWVVIKYQLDRASRAKVEESKCMKYKGHVPAKLLGLVESEDNGKKNIYAIVHTCEWRTKKESNQDSGLTKIWSLHYSRPKFHSIDKEGYEHPVGKLQTYEPKISFIAVDCIVDVCLVIEEYRGMKENVSNKDKRYTEEFWYTQKLSNKSNRDKQCVEEDACKVPFDKDLFRRVMVIRDHSEWGNEFI